MKGFDACVLAMALVACLAFLERLAEDLSR
jgi:hypothetical protein